MMEKEKEDADRERKAMLAVDWHDFSVVAAISFGSEDINLPPPVTPESLGVRLVEMAQAEAEMREQIQRREAAMNEEVRLIGA